MRMARFTCVCALMATALVAQTGVSPEAREWMNQGVSAYRQARYPEAVQAFQKAAEVDRQSAVPMVYLGSAWMNQYGPGVVTPENLERKRQAVAAFTAALQRGGNSIEALEGLASMAYTGASAAQGNATERAQQLDEAARWYEQLARVAPERPTAWYWRGVIAWAKAHPTMQEARRAAGMRPEEPGPIRDLSQRLNARSVARPEIDDGIRFLERALEIKPGYDDAMAYLNLLVRARADLQDTPEEWRRETALADTWLQKTMMAKRAMAGQIAPQPASMGTMPKSPDRIRISGNVSTAKLRERIDPVYPPLAMQARIQGTVLLNAVISKEGLMQNLTVVEGHPLLREAALQAVRHWVYEPTLLNGQPVEVVTQVEVPFTLQ